MARNPSQRLAGAYIGAAEAIRLLGVKPATLYTYVSRGWIRRVAAPGKKESLYYKEDVEKVRTRSGTRAPQGVLAAAAMRYGQPVVPTSITEITDRGPRYRTRLAVDMATQGVAFEAAAELLWTGMALQPDPWPVQPTPKQVLDLVSKLGRSRQPINIHDAFAIVTLAAGIARGSPLERVHETATDVLAARALILLLTGSFGLLASSHAYRPPGPGEAVAEALARSLEIRATPHVLRVLNAALVLCADHELNPATFVARIAASSEGDLHSCIAAAVSANSGTRIARGCDRIETFLRALRQRSRSELAPRSELPALDFSHPLYPNGDPRGQCLLDIVRGLDTRSARSRPIFGYLDRAERDYNLHPRLEVALAVLAIALGVPQGTAAGIYTLGRVAGWVAHISEQRLAGFLIRPRARFVATPS